MMEIEGVFGFILFVACLTLALLNYPDYVYIDKQIQASTSKYIRAMYYLYGYIVIVFKALLALIFVFVFVMVALIIVVGIFKPMMSDGVNSDTSVYANSGYSEIVLKAKEGYFALIGALAQKTFHSALYVFNFPPVLVTLFAFTPIFILCVALVHCVFWNPKDMDDQEKENYLATNYHLFSVMFLSIMVTMILLIGLMCMMKPVAV